ncbi:hypothetical protein OG21DRAFT_1166489 [Imleria badia]|nr:hypothetical protein OG21DRAFT_1166489 [Imleria badia]
MWRPIVVFYLLQLFLHSLTGLPASLSRDRKLYWCLSALRMACTQLHHSVQNCRLHRQRAASNIPVSNLSTVAIVLSAITATTSLSPGQGSEAGSHLDQSVCAALPNDVHRVVFRRACAFTPSSGQGSVTSTIITILPFSLSGALALLRSGHQEPVNLDLKLPSQFSHLRESSDQH